MSGTVIDCAIFQAVGSCIMPKEGLFARVTRGGTIGMGNVVEIMKEGEKEDHGKRG